jgi:hypothetical protein
MAESVSAELVVEDGEVESAEAFGVAGEQIGQPVHPRAGYVGCQLDRGAERQFHEPGSDAEGLGRSPSRSRIRRTSGSRIVLRRQ